MDQFSIHEGRMLYFHRVLMDQLRRTPGLLDRARAQLERMRAGRPDPHGVWAEWAALLEAAPGEMERAILADTPRGGLLRANSPLAEALSSEERNALWQRIGLHQFTALYLQAAGDLGLDPAEQAAILEISPAQLSEWRDGPPTAMSAELLDRLKPVIAIHRALERLFPEADFRRTWLRSRIDLFADTPLALLMAGKAAVVQAHLTAALVPLLGDGERPSH